MSLSNSSGGFLLIVIPGYRSFLGAITLLQLYPRVTPTPIPASRGLKWGGQCLD